MSNQQEANTKANAAHDRIVANMYGAKFAINDRVKIVKDGKTISGKIDEIVLFRRSNEIGYRVVDKSDWSWCYVGENEVTKQ